MAGRVHQPERAGIKRQTRAQLGWHPTSPELIVGLEELSYT